MKKHKTPEGPKVEEPKDSLVRVQYADLVCNVKKTPQTLGDVHITVRDYNQSDYSSYGSSSYPLVRIFRLSREQALDLAGALKLAVEQAR